MFFRCLVELIGIPAKKKSAFFCPGRCECLRMVLYSFSHNHGNGKWHRVWKVAAIGGTHFSLPLKETGTSSRQITRWASKNQCLAEIMQVFLCFPLSSFVRIMISPLHFENSSRWHTGTRIWEHLTTLPRFPWLVGHYVQCANGVEVAFWGMILIIFTFNDGNPPKNGYINPRSCDKFMTIRDTMESFKL